MEWTYPPPPLDVFNQLLTWHSQGITVSIVDNGRQYVTILRETPSWAVKIMQPAPGKRIHVRLDKIMRGLLGFERSKKLRWWTVAWRVNTKISIDVEIEKTLRLKYCSASLSLEALIKLMLFPSFNRGFFKPTAAFFVFRDIDDPCNPSVSNACF